MMQRAFQNSFPNMMIHFNNNYRLFKNKIFQGLMKHVGATFDHQFIPKFNYVIPKVMMSDIINKSFKSDNEKVHYSFRDSEILSRIQYWKRVKYLIIFLMSLIYYSKYYNEESELFLEGNEFKFFWQKKESSNIETGMNESSSNNNSPNSNSQDGNIQASEKQQINKQQPKGKMKIVKVKPDGNCLFRAISMGLYGTESKHMDVRYDAVDWMRKNLDTKIEDLPFRHSLFMENGDTNNNADVERHLRRMLMSGIWGDFSCIVALSQCLEPQTNFKVAVLSHHAFGTKRGQQRVESIVGRFLFKF